MILREFVYKINHMRELINVLIVDDNNEFAQTISELIELEGYSCKVAGTYSGALSAFQNFDIDCIISDLNLPDGTGIQLLHNIRKEGSHIPLILISGNITTSTYHEALQLGAFDLFEKPINIPKLFNVIKNAIMAGIQYRNLRNKIFELADTESQKKITSYLNTIKRLRASNFENKS